MRRVVITGLGVVSALGTNAAGNWDSLAAARSGIAPITLFPNDALTAKVAAEVKGYNTLDHFPEKQSAFMDRFAQFAVVAAREAVGHSGIAFDGQLKSRTAVVVGSGVGGITTLDENFERLYKNGLRVHPFCIPRFMANAGASHVSMALGITGPSFTVASACASANHALGVALQMLRAGAVDVALSGGSEATITFGTMKGWEALRVMAPDACRPFSAGRRGMVLGEGAGIFVLETLEHAKARGAAILAELMAVGMSSDAGDLTLPNLEGPTAAMRAALAEAAMAPEAIDYINAHGTGTIANDATETKAIHAVFGGHARTVPVSSTKSAHGHGLGAAGAIELAATLLAMKHSVVPATLNYVEPDPACDLNLVVNQPREARIDAAMSNSFAFGGLNAVVIVRRFAG